MDIAKTLLENLKTRLQNNPVQLDTDSLIDFLYSYYVSFVSTTREKTTDHLCKALHKWSTI